MRQSFRNKSGKPYPLYICVIHRWCMGGLKVGGHPVLYKHITQCKNAAIPPHTAHVLFLSTGKQKQQITWTKHYQQPLCKEAKETQANLPTQLTLQLCRLLQNLLAKGSFLYRFSKSKYQQLGNLVLHRLLSNYLLLLRNFMLSKLLFDENLLMKIIFMKIIKLRMPTCYNLASKSWDVEPLKH